MLAPVAVALLAAAELMAQHAAHGRTRSGAEHTATEDRTCNATGGGPEGRVLFPMRHAGTAGQAEDEDQDKAWIE